MELKNRGVLVTGGASGLGAACVRLLAQAGAKVVIADLNSEIGETLAAELRGEGAGVFFACANVASEESLKAAVQTTIEKDRKSTRLNSSHLVISYAVFCLKKKK